eukprot:m.337658 g.337658  ORF g.337658 m.337658 type:complete len:263 (+) comp18197_c0_seq1:328-1116(+)
MPPELPSEKFQHPSCIVETLLSMKTTKDTDASAEHNKTPPKRLTSMPCGLPISTPTQHIPHATPLVLLPPPTLSTGTIYPATTPSAQQNTSTVAPTRTNSHKRPNVLPAMPHKQPSKTRRTMPKTLSETDKQRLRMLNGQKASQDLRNRKRKYECALENKLNELVEESRKLDEQKAVKEQEFMKLSSHFRSVPYAYTAHPQPHQTLPPHPIVVHATMGSMQPMPSMSRVSYYTQAPPNLVYPPTLTAHPSNLMVQPTIKSSS